jgi:hypothetical protein
LIAPDSLSLSGPVRVTARVTRFEAFSPGTRTIWDWVLSPTVHPPSSLPLAPREQKAKAVLES